MSFPTTTALSRQLLTQVLRNVADPRDRPSVRHDLPKVLSLAITGVLAGCRSLTAIGEHTTDLPAAEPEALGLPEGRSLPSESTVSRVVQDLDSAGLDTLPRLWLWTRADTINGRSYTFDGNGRWSTPATDGSCPDWAPVKGNVNRQGEKIFHQPGDQSYKVTKPEQCFTTPDDAKSAGFRAAKR